jgi:TPP-dependent pyruvate/acetoin dehydrogenase alpha subunit
LRAGDVQRDQGLNLLRTMWLVRRFEERVAALANQGALPGTVHTSVGQEAVAVGACAALGTDDVIVSNHRGHGHCLAKGMDPRRAMAELFGKAAGVCGGKGGSMHLADPSIGVLGANGIVGAGLPLATGAALAAKQLGTGTVAVAFFGEGATSTGNYHEAMTLAALWSLPVVFVCENNGFVEFTPAEQLVRRSVIVDVAAAQGITARQVDGNDVEAVLRAVGDAVAECRRGDGPALVEALTSRWAGHYEGDPQDLRDTASLPAERLRDPLSVQTARLEARGVECDGVEDEAREVIELAEEFARAADLPDPAAALTDVYG